MDQLKGSVIELFKVKFVYKDNDQTKDALYNIPILQFVMYLRVIIIINM